MTRSGPSLGVFGATGQVGQVIRAILASRPHPFGPLRFFASARSAGRRLEFAGTEIVVEDSATADTRGLDLAIFSNGASTSRELAPRVAAGGTVVVDNSSAWRMNPQVPLVVAEINPADLKDRPLGIVANPNCSTMVALMALAPLHQVAGLRRAVVSTYQAVSGAGRKGVDELAGQIAAIGTTNVDLVDKSEAGPELAPSCFAAPIAYDALPLIGKLGEDGQSDEEAKFQNESRRILHAPELTVACTCVRVPVMTGHGVSMALEFESAIDPDRAASILRDAPGVSVVDLPTSRRSTGKDEVLVGRIRRDPSVDHGLLMYVAGDNLRKGAALNAVQLAEILASQ